MARAEAQATGATRLTEPLIRQALRRVEFLLANQVRLFQQVLKGWLRAWLSDPATALRSLRLMALTPEGEPGSKEPLAESRSLSG